MHDPPVRAPSPSPRLTEWLSLGPAARLLGVDADTLRRWADAGRIEAFTTPGGHRRFSRRSIERLIAAHRPGHAGSVAPRLGATSDRLTAAYRRRAAALPGFRLAMPLDTSAREGVRLDGRGLVDSLVRYLDAHDAAERGRIEGEATELAVGLARRLAAADLPLADAVARFVAAREPLLDGILAVARRRRLDADRLAAVFRDASSILDRLLLAFIAAHDAASAAAHGPAAASRAAGAPLGSEHRRADEGAQPRPSPLGVSSEPSRSR